MTRIKSSIAALLLATVVLPWEPLPLQAADFHVWTDGRGQPAISIVGKIEHDDYQKFENVIAGMKQEPQWIYLTSPGGDLDAGLAIAYKIQRSEYGTVVSKDRVCASLCALIWLAGSNIWYSQSASIGFHAARFSKDKMVTPDGNAQIGAYLARLGYSDHTIQALTRSEEMFWLTSDKAQELGIRAKMIPVSMGQPSQPESKQSNTYWCGSTQVLPSVKVCSNGNPPLVKVN
jgi:ATP-dependent protease ClpP protease subunit